MPTFLIYNKRAKRSLQYIICTNKGAKTYNVEGQGVDNWLE